MVGEWIDELSTLRETDATGYATALHARAEQLIEIARAADAAMHPAHASDCPALSYKRMPCQCGAFERANRATSRLRAALEAK